jgi:hypothetical protein
VEQIVRTQMARHWAEEAERTALPIADEEPDPLNFDLVGPHETLSVREGYVVGHLAPGTLTPPDARS